MMSKIVSVIVISIFILGSIQGQPGMRLYAGISGGNNESAVINPDGMNIGWHIGGDFRLNEGGMFFILGGRYTSIDFTTNEDLFSGDVPKLGLINTRLGLGYKLFKISNNIVIRGKTLASIDYIYNTPISKTNEKVGFEEFRRINSTAGGLVGLGISIGSITFDLEYAIGIFNLISENKETKPSFISASAGAFF